VANVGSAVLADFHPGVREWFESTYSAPTDVQRRSWPVIRARRHALITAPTGSGKTLTAFLTALDDFATGKLETGATRVLYVSPLKALNNDIRRNLIEPLTALHGAFTMRGDVYPAVRVATRSGDTPSDERQRLLRRPPEILVTTPESLLLMLTTQRGRQALAHVATVVIDEIHSVVDNRRGVVLAAALERLAQISGEFQRVALSATVRPLGAVAEFVAGRDDDEPRAIEIVDSPAAKRIHFIVRFPADVRERTDAGEPVWLPLADAFRSHIAHNRSTLFFTNSRRLAEKITLNINDEATEPLAYAHHGSLARDIRTEVEARLKRGEMRAIVATNSLEMGIDIGHLDEVVLVQSPPTIASTLQRIGRAGHRVGEVSRGVLYPTHAKDFVEAAALACAIDERDIEPTQPMNAPLDVLAQLVIAFTTSETWHTGDLYDMLRRSHPFRRLSRESFDLVIEMLAGRYAGTRVRDLKPRIAFDRIGDSIHANKGAALAFYASGGTIPDRGYFQLRHADTGSKIGELDEEFVWEATIGQLFSFGSQQWQIQRITHNDVLVTSARVSGSSPPFWRSESANRSFHYSNRIGAFLEEAESFLARSDSEGLAVRLAERHHFEPTAATELVAYLTQQREHTHAPLPHAHHLLVEQIDAAPGGYKGSQLEHQTVLHAHWGGRVNRPLALAIGAAIDDQSSMPCEIHATDDAIVVQTEAPLDIVSILDRLLPAAIDGHLRNALESSGFFGARFRECAGRALLLTRSRFNQRLPLWLSRMNAKKLMSTVSRFEDFPILLETWRTCLEDEFDIPALRRCLDELRSGEIEVGRSHTSNPSPFASGIAWGQISSTYMYADDSPQVSGPSALSDDLIRAAVYDESLRPRIDHTIAEAFESKRQRRAPGYEMLDATDVAEWLKERVLIAAAEWHALDDHGIEPIWLAAGDRRWACHHENARHVAARLFGAERDDLPHVADGRDAADLAREILSFYGPRTAAELRALLPPAIDESVLDLLLDDGALVVGPLLRDDPATQYCDAENLEILLRLQRAARRATVEPRPVTQLPAFLAAWHALGAPSESAAIADSFERLRGFAAPCAIWLDDVLAARHVEFQDHHFDAALRDGFVWLGAGQGMLRICAAEEAELFAPSRPDDGLSGAFRDPRARYSYLALADLSGTDLRQFNGTFWSAVWQGSISADSVVPLRQGLARKFEVVVTPARLAATSRRRARANMASFAGNWFVNASPSGDPDALTVLEDAKVRARMLLDRYGIVSREIANREGGEFRWAALFKALRLLELAGEVTVGIFFTELSGPQFALPRALRRLERDGPATAWWVSAHDPVAPCGLGIDWPQLHLPQRRAGNYLAFVGHDLVLVAENNGRRLTFAPNVDAAGWQAATALLTHLLERERRIALDTIDGAAAATSARLAALAERFELHRDHRAIELTLSLGRR